MLDSKPAALADTKPKPRTHDPGTTQIAASGPELTPIPILDAHSIVPRHHRLHIPSLLIHHVKERRTLEPTTDRKPSPAATVLSRIESTEAAPEERPGTYIGAARIHVQGKAASCPKSLRKSRAASKQAERAQL